MAQFSFDVSIMEEFLGLTSGMTVVLASQEEIFEPLRMKTLMMNNGVGAVCFTPAYAAMLFSIPEMNEALANIKTYDFGAEAFPGSLYEKIVEVNPNAYVMNGYGPTEATISCTVKMLNFAENITIGKPNYGVSAFVVDENLRQVPPCVTGELLICGEGVGRGYQNLPEQTAKVFVDYNGMRGYRTGDYAQINENDEIVFLGSKDNQINNNSII